CLRARRAADCRPGRGARRDRADRAPARRGALVLPLHPVVRAAGVRGGARCAASGGGSRGGARPGACAARGAGRARNGAGLGDEGGGFGPLCYLGGLIGPLVHTAPGIPALFSYPGASIRICSTPVAWPPASASTRIPFSHGSSSAVSNFTGIIVRKRSSAWSRRTPITPPRAPVIPTSVT